MNERKLIEGWSFEEYVRRNPMPTKTLDNNKYKIIERRDLIERRDSK